MYSIVPIIITCHMIRNFIEKNALLYALKQHKLKRSYITKLDKQVVSNIFFACYMKANIKCY